MANTAHERRLLQSEAPTQDHAELYRTMARHFAGLAEAYKTLHKWAEEGKDRTT